MFADNNNPFATTLVNDKVLIAGYFFDDKHMIHKYKVEDDKPTINNAAMFVGANVTYVLFIYVSLNCICFNKVDLPQPPLPST